MGELAEQPNSSAVPAEVDEVVPEIGANDKLMNPALRDTDIDWDDFSLGIIC